MPDMVRPEWTEFCGHIDGGYIQCGCGEMLGAKELIRKHWQAGHFDYPQLKSQQDLALKIIELNSQLAAFIAELRDLEAWLRETAEIPQAGAHSGDDPPLSKSGNRVATMAADQLAEILKRHV